MATAKSAKPAAKVPKIRPVHEIRFGRIRAAIWLNETENGPRHNVTITRLYKKEGEDWKDSTSFGRDDLPLVAKVCDQAHTWIFEQAQERSQTNGNGEGDHSDGSNGEGGF